MSAASYRFELPEHRLPSHRTRSVPIRELPDGDRRWLEVPGSMTRAIAVTLGARPGVTPTFEGAGRAMPWEARLLGLRSTRCHVREVTLTVSGLPVLLARTLADLEDPAVRTLRKLERQPLAEVLFSDPGWYRAATPLPLRTRLNQERLHGRASLWRHRDRARGALLVTEFFLPGLAIHAPASAAATVRAACPLRR